MRRLIIRTVLMLVLIPPSYSGFFQAGTWAMETTADNGELHDELLDRRVVQVQAAAEDARGSAPPAALAKAVRTIVGWWSGDSAAADCENCTAADSGPFALSLSPGVWLLFAGVVGMACVARRNRVDSPDNPG